MGGRERREGSRRDHPSYATFFRFRIPEIKGRRTREKKNGGGRKRGKERGEGGKKRNPKPVAILDDPASLHEGEEEEGKKKKP